MNFHSTLKYLALRHGTTMIHVGYILHTNLRNTYFVKVRVKVHHTQWTIFIVNNIYFIWYIQTVSI